MTNQTIDVTLYVKPDCQPCVATKRQLDRLGIDYFTVDLSESPEALERVKSWNFQQSPVVEVYDTVEKAVTRWSGYRPDLLKGLVQ